MNFKLYLIFLISLFSYAANAQVSGIGYTISPAGEYVWWDDKAGLEDNYLVGGKLGFSFGEYFELRANYMQSLNLKTDLSGFELMPDSLVSQREVKLSRWGGELKANLTKGKWLPFVTLGTGIQTMKMDTFAEQKQIYVDYGLGIKFSLADRYTFTIEGKNTLYRFNSGSYFITDAEKTALGLTASDFEQEQLQNWSLAATLQFYLGGRKPGTLTDLDRAYFNAFSGGLNSLVGTLEPTVGKVEFDESLNFRDTWLAGGSAGIDLGPYIGIRGFYLQSLEEGETSKFDKLAIYGGELRARLNVSQGLVPYLMLGGGNIDVQADYVGKDSLVMPENKAFAMGGLGLILPLSKNFKIFGSAKAMMTTGSDLDAIAEPDQLQTSWMYSAGLRLNFGRSRKSPNSLVQSKIDQALNQQVNAQEAAKIAAAKAVSAAKIAEAAVANGEVETAALASAQAAKAANEAAEAAQKVSEATKTVEAIEKGTYNNNGQSSITMSAAELQNLIDEVMENMSDKGASISPLVQQQMMQDRASETIKQQEIDRRLRSLEIAMVRMEEQQKGQLDAMKLELNQQLKLELEAFTKAFRTEMQSMERKMDASFQGLMQQQSNTPIENKVQEEIIEEEIEEKNDIEIIEKKGGLLGDSYKSASGFAGVMMANEIAAVLGVRLHYGLGKTNLELAPEVFVGLGNSSSFGLMANIIAPINLKSYPKIKPYIGLGGGLIDQEGDAGMEGVYNIALGAKFDLWKGNMFADYTTRNLFEYHQAAVGYRLNF